ncbi:MAG: O-methyltransferase [Chitinophagaceae bacterium]|nr:O-methyltransferase [Chitinophagaceae bacterium]
MSFFITEPIQKYVETFGEEEHPLLQKIRRYTHSKTLHSQMLSGYYQGRILSLFSRMIQPKYILEIGTFTGYSALCLAEGLQKDGKLITIDINEELESTVKSFFAESGYKENIELVIGNAVNIIPHLAEKFDIIYIDADKQNYETYFHLSVEKLQEGGYILVDNVLWKGKITEVGEKDDKHTVFMRSFNEMIRNDTRFSPLIFPIRDGLMVLTKNKSQKLNTICSMY